ncbi:MAG: ABC transporter permease [Chloroflexota bacterium]
MAHHGMESTAPVALAAPRTRNGALLDFARRMGRKPLGVAGLVVAVVLIFTAVFPPLISPIDPYDTHYGALRKPPSFTYLLGSDQFGRDQLSRIIWGARISLYVGIISVAIGTTTGALLGLLSGYAGGKVDLSIQRLMDTIQAFPLLVLALTIVAALGASVTNVIFALSVVLVPQAARVVRSSAMAVKNAQFVDAARAVGAGTMRILFHHILPQCIAPYIIIATSGIGWAVLVEASLSFLGLGTPPPIPSWGGMLSGEGLNFAQSSPWLAIYPGLSISLAVFAFSLLGDALRDVLDPRLKR